MTNGDETFTIPLAEKRYFGAGLRRQKVNFVSASEPNATLPDSNAAGADASNAYLTLVMKKSQDDENDGVSGSNSPSALGPSARPICTLCKTPIDHNSTTPHDATFAHQLAMPHSLGVNTSIDRTRKGYLYLQKHGWDPDEHKGLGAKGEGILHPVKAVKKQDKHGIGLKVDTAAGKKVLEKKIKKLNAKEVRQAEMQSRRRHEHLHQEFYSSGDVAQYLSKLNDNDQPKPTIKYEHKSFSASFATIGKQGSRSGAKKLAC